MMMRFDLKQGTEFPNDLCRCSKVHDDDDDDDGDDYDEGGNDDDNGDDNGDDDDDEILFEVGNRIPQ